MAVKIRLQRKGRKKAPYYHIVVADARSPRDGKFIERLGFYNPTSVPAAIDIDRDKAFDWLMKGAQPTDTVTAILRYKGILYRKHLARGVAKGALTQEKADQMYQDWVQQKEGLILKKVEETKQKQEEFHKSITAVTRAPKVKEVAAEETAAENTEATASEEESASAPEESTETETKAEE